MPMLRSPSRRRLGGLLVSLVLVAACNGETKYDVYMKGLEIEGDAERGPCKLHYSDAAPTTAAQLSGDQVLRCLRATDKALEYYDKAAQMGYEDVDFKAVHARAQQRKKRLESMLEMVRMMEREQRTGAPPG